MKVIIIGGVAGGAGTAARLRRNDENAEIIMFEKGEYISFANCGLPYYVGGVITDKSKLTLQTPQSFYDRFCVDVRVKSEIVAVNTEKKQVTVRKVETEEEYTESYDKLVLAPGAAPVHPSIPGGNLEHVFTLRNIPDTYAISNYLEKHSVQSCAVVGAGFIGIEMAENLQKKGLMVSVIEAADHVMAPLDGDMAHEVHNYIRSMGVELYLEKSCSEIHRHEVILSDGTEVKADLVLLSVGVKPETTFLKGSGILLGDQGEILVNDFMQTNVLEVYGLGDAVSVKNIVNGRRSVIPLASPANKQGRIVGDNLCGRKRAYRGSQGTSIMKFYHMTVACTGEKEGNLKRDGIPYRKSFTYSASHAGYYPGGDKMSIKLLFSPENGKVLGAQIVGGEGVDKRIDSLANAVRFGLDVYQLQEMELAYAPPFSSAKDPVNIAGYVAGNILEGTMVPFYVEEVDEIPDGAVCIDVRTKEEYESGHIPGFINIPVDELRQHMAELDLTRLIYVNCQIGQRGYIAACILMQKGACVYNLSGGYQLYGEAQRDC